MTTVTRQINFEVKGRHKRAVLALSGEAEEIAEKHASNRAQATRANHGRIPRLAKLMALAIRFDGLLKDGVVGSQSELADLAQISQPRMTQIMNLLHLSPEIQEEILFLEPVEKGRDPITERDIRPIVREMDWSKQIGCWGRLGHHGNRSGILRCDF
tara:strand:- start:11865 stop:12335 length:471 start_codon:yes stop_codon:yes gene_type:complete